jgi:hypothetical protein
MITVLVVGAVPVGAVLVGAVLVVAALLVAALPVGGVLVVAALEVAALLGDTGGLEVVALVHAAANVMTLPTIIAAGAPVVNRRIAPLPLRLTASNEQHRVAGGKFSKGPMARRRNATGSIVVRVE